MLAMVVLVSASVLPIVPAGAATTLEDVVDLPPELQATRAAGNAAWLEAVDPALGAWVVDATAVRPAALPGRGGGVVFAHGVRFDTAAHARQAWTALRSADAGDGSRYDVEGFGEVHALRDPLGIAGVALVDYHRLLGTDIYVVQLRVDGSEEVSDHARDVLAWHVRHTRGGSSSGRLVVGGVAVASVLGIGLVLLRQRRG